MRMTWIRDSSNLGQNLVVLLLFWDNFLKYATTVSFKTSTYPSSMIIPFDKLYKPQTLF